MEQLARARTVEQLCETICKDAHKRDREDLAQIVYLSLLTAPPETIVQLYSSEQMTYYLTRVIKNQYNSKTSPYARKITGFRRRTSELWSCDCIDESTL